jgi:colanic acid/amylovoran biosynthesis glycosyltransferase
LVSILTGTTFSFTVHGPEEFDKSQSLHLAEKVERAAFVVAISSFCRSQLYRVTRYTEWKKIKVIHCGLDSAFTSLEAEPLPATNKFVCVGRLCEQKGQLLLVEAMAELIAEVPELELVLVGDGEMRSPIEELIEQYGVGQSIRITGWATAEQVKQQILDARAMILPSFAEGLPVVLMEAMALKRPVLTTMINGIPELVINEATGWLVPAGSKSHLKAAVRKCLAMPTEQLMAMGQAARQRVLERHSAERQAKMLQAEFDQFLADPPVHDTQPPTA